MWKRKLNICKSNLTRDVAIRPSIIDPLQLRLHLRYCNSNLPIIGFWLPKLRFCDLVRHATYKRVSRDDAPMLMWLPPRCRNAWSKIHCFVQDYCKKVRAEVATVGGRLFSKAHTRQRGLQLRISSCWRQMSPFAFDYWWCQLWFRQLGCKP